MANRKKEPQDKALMQDRLDAANKFIMVISGCGREFFKHDGFVSTLELSSTGRVFFIDYYTKKRIYTHTRFQTWRGFTSGGTLQSLIESLRDFVIKGKTLRAEYFQPDMGAPDMWDNHIWGYDDDSMLIVKSAAVRLGIAIEISECGEDA
jgi:hypothetical protein